MSDDDLLEELELNRRRVGRTDIDDVVADIFDWRPDRSHDVVFFSFWLSHVPRARVGWSFAETTDPDQFPGQLQIPVPDNNDDQEDPS